MIKKRDGSFQIQIFHELGATHGVNFKPLASGRLFPKDKDLITELDTKTTGLRGNIEPKDAQKAVINVNFNFILIFIILLGK